MYPFDAELLNAFKAYRQVLLENRVPPQPAEEKPFSERLWQLIEARLEGQPIDLLKQIWDCSIKGLTTAREGSHEKARFYFHQARALAYPEHLGREGVLLASSVTCAAEAYLMHRLGLFEAAYTLVQTALDADEELERVYGFELLIGHRLQLVHNAIRVMIKEQRYERALALLGASIAFIEGYGETLPYHHSWAASRLKSDTGWPQMERQLIHELATAMVAAPPTAWAAFCAHLHLPSFLAGASLDPLSRDWIVVKNSCQQGEDEAFLSAMPGLLKQAFSESKVLFFTLLWDYHQLLERTQTSVAKALQIQLLRDSRLWSPPKPIVPLLEAAKARHLPSAIENTA